MIRYTKTTIIATNLDGRERKGNNERTVRIRIQTRGKGRYISTRVPMTPDQYELSFGQKSKKPRNGQKENLILAEFEHIYNIIRKLEDTQEKAPSYEQIMNEVKTKTYPDEKINIKMLYDVYLQYIQEKKKLSYLGITKNTMKKLEDTKLLYKNTDTISSEDINKWAEELKKQGKKTSTITTYTQNIKTVFNYGVKKHLLKTNPLTDIKVYQRVHVKKEINEETLKFLLTANEQEVGLKHKYFQYLQYFRLSFWAGGANIIDILNWTYDNKDKNELTFIRRKTKDKTNKLIKIPLSEQITEAINILPKGKNHMFPILDGIEPYSEKEKYLTNNLKQNINKTLKLISQKEGFEKITFSYARHMYPTIMARIGTNLKMISAGMGHATISTTEAFYMEDFTPEQRKKEAEKMQNYILASNK